MSTNSGDSPAAEATPAAETPGALAPVPPVTMSPVRNTIQRNKWPEHDGLPGGQVGPASVNPQAEDESQQIEIDLAQLADDVFPYIKRLIEQESDRIASRFRS